MNQPRFWRNNRGNRHRDGNFRARGGRGGRFNGQFGPNRNDYYGQNYNNFGRNFQHPPKVQRDFPTKRLSEEDIGVTEYINDHEGFNGIIKSRYSDFQVSEINLNGEIAKLTNEEPPELPKEKDIDEDEDLVLNKYNLEILPMETWDNINKLAVAQQPCTEKVQIDVTGMTKEQRTKIHDAVKKAFGKGIVGSTVTMDDKKYVSFEKFRKGVRIDRRVKWPWPGEYTYFIVHKENCDTMEAASRLAERLRLNPRPTTLGYAGTKDRRAKTSQWFSLRKVEPARVAAAASALRDLRVGNYSFASVPLRLGMLAGNRFRITLRNVTATDECIDSACTLLQRDGFINYYGLQRFGTRIETPTYEIGLKLFQGNLVQAIRLILEQRAGPLQHVLHVFHAAGAAAAWRACPRSLRAPPELRLIQSLATDPDDLARAIDRIPRNARLLYIHSYQSLVWNKVASERLQRLGLRPAAGDLVPLAPLHASEDYDEEEDSEPEEGADEMEPDGDGGGEREEAARGEDKKPKGGGREQRREVPVKVLTAEEAASGRYSVTDVVLPLPGHAVRYPPNMVDHYERLLTQDGLTLDMRNKIKQFSMSGAYRRLVVRPAAVQWRCVRYDDPHADLVLSDRDELEGRALPAPAPADGKYKALLLTFTLPTSCYATMALRELLKVDTSCDNQALQNNYHKVKARAAGGDGPPPTDAGIDRTDGPPPADENPDGAEGPPPADESPDEPDGVGEKRKLEMDTELDAKKVKQDAQDPQL